MKTTTSPGKAAGNFYGLGTYLGLAGALLAMIALFSVLSDHFLSYDTFSTLANQIPDLMVLAVGMTFILIIGGIDLSVGSVLALAASAVSVAILGWGWSVLPAALLGMGCAALAGTITGSITVAWRIPSFIVSLGVLEMARGVASANAEESGKATDAAASTATARRRPANGSFMGSLRSYDYCEQRLHRKALRQPSHLGG